MAQERTLKVRIPPSVDEGAQMRLGGEGEGGVGASGGSSPVSHVEEKCLATASMAARCRFLIRSLSRHRT